MQAPSLFLIGGAASKSIGDLVGITGKDAHFVVLTHASDIPRQRGDEQSAALRALGVNRITVITPRSASQKLPADTQVIFMTGGDQLRLVRLLEKSGLAEAVRDAYQAGILVAGTSAGAACAPYTMIAGGMSDKKLTPGALLLTKGLCLRNDLVVDTHFSERNRAARLRAAVATLPAVTGLGLDEDAAALISGNRVRVFGKGDVFQFTAGRDAATWHWRALQAVQTKRSPGEQFFL